MRLAKMMGALLVLALLCFAAAYAAAAPTMTRKIVKFTEQTPASERLAIAGRNGRVVRELKLIDAVVIEAPSSQMQINEARLRANKAVVRVENDPKIKWIRGASPLPARVTDVPLPEVSDIVLKARQSVEPTQETPWGIRRVNAQPAWSVTRGKGVKVAVIDTGIQLDHADLAANVKGGWNAIDPAASSTDDNGHGTHCAGSIAAVDNGEGVVGVAPEVDLYSVKVLDAGGSGTFSDVIAGMLWAAENKMDVASMSLGASRGTESLREAVDAMVAAGVVVVAAAGNSGSDVGFPAAYPGAIAIAAMDETDKVAWFSSRGPEVAFIAPGVDVKSTYLGGGYDSLSGTSMATPHMSGLVALALGSGRASAAGIRTALTGAATPLPDVPATEQGAGVVNAEALVK